jgi:hypothetical protein
MSDDSFDHVQRTCAELARAGQPITFVEVAARTGIPRNTLYRRRELRETIERHRDPRSETLTLSRLATRLEQLQQTLEAIAANVRRHEEDLRRLKRATQPARERSA